MDKVSVNVPGSGLATPLRQTAAELGLRSIHLRLGRVTTSGGSARARFTATADLASGHTWTYPGQLRAGHPEPGVAGGLEPVRHLPAAPGG